MSQKIAQFVNLVLIVLVAGAMWSTWLGVSRSMGSFSASTYLDIGHAMIANLSPVMPVLMVAAVGQAFWLW